MKAHRTIRYRLHPRTEGKAHKLHELAGACRFVWNHFVGKLQDDYRFYGKVNPSWYTIGKQFTNLKKFHPWLNDYSANIVKLSLKPLENNYKQFWKGQGGLPRFHGKQVHAPSFPILTRLFKLNGSSLHIQKIGQVTLTGDNPYPNAKPVSGTIKYEAGKWYAYIVFEVEIISLPASLKEVGIDRNVRQITCSDGEVYELAKNLRLEFRRKRYQRMMARRQRGNRKQGIKPSNRYNKARCLYQKTSQKIVQERTNWCHQTSREIANKYNVIYLENLNTKGMTASAKGTADAPGKNVSQKSGLNKAILSSGWYKLDQCLSYKSTVIKVPAAYTSQACNQCGCIDKNNRKTQADFHCQACGHRDGADLNAALNILASGIGAAGRGDGGVTRSVKRQ